MVLNRESVCIRSYCTSVFYEDIYIVRACNLTNLLRRNIKIKGNWHTAVWSGMIIPWQPAGRYMHACMHAPVSYRIYL